MQPTDPTALSELLNHLENEPVMIERVKRLWAERDAALGYLEEAQASRLRAVDMAAPASPKALASEAMYRRGFRAGVHAVIRGLEEQGGLSSAHTVLLSRLSAETLTWSHEAHKGVIGAPGTSLAGVRLGDVQ